MNYSPSYNDMLSAYQPYPAPIRPFLLRAETHPLVRSLLTKSFMRVFIDLLGRAPIADPMRPLLLRVPNVAEDLGISTKTVSRTLTFLQKQGWLNPNPVGDGRNNWGEFCTRQYLLTTELRQLLGLPTENSYDSQTVPETQHILTVNNEEDCTPLLEDISSVVTPQLNIHDEEKIQENNQKIIEEPSSETEMSCGLYRVNNVFLKEASFKEEAFLNQGEKSNYNKNNVALEKSAPEEIEKQKVTSRISKTISLPTDLTEMAELLQIHPAGICKLMRLAKQANQRLQDIWAAKRNQLLNAGAKEGRAYHYLKSLIETGEDFQFRAKLANTSNTILKTPVSDKNLTETLTDATSLTYDLRSYWNKQYQGDNGLLVTIQADGSGLVSTAKSSNVYVRPFDMESVYEAVRAHRLREIV